uniref:Uncharacterized protein n=1 Tax=Cacopsylla melanoneura TaxID=428564 RepID=A0A8D8RG78_9HEMI
MCCGLCQTQRKNWNTTFTSGGNIPTGKSNRFGQQVKAHGRPSDERSRRAGNQTTNQRTNNSMGRKPGETSLRTVPTEMLHGKSAEWRVTESEEFAHPRFSEHKMYPQQPGRVYGLLVPRLHLC